MKNLKKELNFNEMLLKFAKSDFQETMLVLKVRVRKKVIKMCSQLMSFSFLNQCE